MFIISKQFFLNISVACDPKEGFCAFIFMRSDPQHKASPSEKLSLLLTQYQNRSGSSNSTCKFTFCHFDMFAWGVYIVSG